MVLAGFVLTLRCLPYGSNADTEPLLMETLRAGTIGEKAGDTVADMAEVRGKERMNPARGVRGCIKVDHRAGKQSAGHPILSPSGPSRLQVNATGKLGSFLLRRRTY